MSSPVIQFFLLSTQKVDLPSVSLIKAVEHIRTDFFPLGWWNFIFQVWTNSFFTSGLPYDGTSCQVLLKLFDFFQSGSIFLEILMRHRCNITGDIMIAGCLFSRKHYLFKPFPLIILWKYTVHDRFLRLPVRWQFYFLVSFFWNHPDDWLMKLVYFWIIADRRIRFR